MKLTFRFPKVKKGGPGSGHHGHSGRPGKRGGSASGGGSSGTVPGARYDKPHPKGYSIKFDAIPGYHRMSSGSDKAMDATLSRIERTLGIELPTDERTGYPTFTYYLDGEELGGG